MRVKRGFTARRRRQKIFKIAKGFRGRSNNTIRQTTQRAEKSLQYVYRDRRNRKREFRRLWITRISAAARLNGVSYSKFMAGLNAANIEINRKMLAELGALEPEAFSAVANIAKDNLAQN